MFNTIYNLIKNHTTIQSIINELNLDSIIDDFNIIYVVNYLLKYKDDFTKKPISDNYVVKQVDNAIYFPDHARNILKSYLYKKNEDFNTIDFNSISFDDLYKVSDNYYSINDIITNNTIKELINFSIYIYNFGTIDNFYEKNILNFLPEYDRNYIKKQPQLKIFFEVMGNKLDNIESKLTNIKNIYDIETVPENILDYLGQNIGYEREEESLKNISFRELLKNIIEIYKIKGTQYSFNLFFKFLGFNIELKEYYFNKDVENPLKTKNTNTKENVQFYLTNEDPTKEVNKNRVASHLDKTRNISDWEIEIESLKTHGCQNPVEYMTGEEGYNKTEKYHNNPWRYFKVNLIRYELNKFLDSGLSTDENDTIKKYIKFLSPTYLLTFININLEEIITESSVIENFNIDDSDYILNFDVINHISDDIIFFDDLDGFKTNIDHNSLSSLFGYYVKRNGEIIRKKYHSKSIRNFYRNNKPILLNDIPNIEIKKVNDYKVVSSSSDFLDTSSLYYLSDEDEYYRYIGNKWEKVISEDYTDHSFPKYPSNIYPDNIMVYSNDVVLSWDYVDDIEDYEIQIFRGDEKIKEVTVKGNTYKYENIVDGEYSFRIRSIFKNLKDNFSPSYNFTIIGDIFPLNNQELQEISFIRIPYKGVKSTLQLFRDKPFFWNSFDHKKTDDLSTLSDMDFGDKYFLYKGKTGIYEYKILGYDWIEIKNHKFSVKKYSDLDNVSKKEPYLWLVEDDNKHYKYQNTQWEEQTGNFDDYTIIKGFSTIDSHANLLKKEKKYGDTWFIDDPTDVLRNDKFFRWDISKKGFVLIDENYAKIATNTSDIFNEDTKYKYFSLEDLKFYEYIEKKDITQDIIKEITSFNNIYNIYIQDKKMYYWRYKYEEDNFSDIYQFTYKEK